MIESTVTENLTDLFKLSDTAVDLAHKINEFLQIKHWFIKDIDLETLQQVKFVCESYNHNSSDKESQSDHQWHIRSRSLSTKLKFSTDWIIDKSTLQTAIHEFLVLTDSLRASSLISMTDSSFNNMQLAQLKQLIDAVIQTWSNRTSDISDSQNNNSNHNNNSIETSKSAMTWKTENLEYFHSNFSDKNDTVLMLVENQSHY